VLFVVVTAGLVMSLYRNHRRQLFNWGLTYLAYSVLQVIANVFAVIFTAGHHKGGGLTSLRDVGAVYLETVLEFMFIYIFIDVSTPCGASFGLPVMANYHQNPTSSTTYLSL
jgi:hypothetical protein